MPPKKAIEKIKIYTRILKESYDRRVLNKAKRKLERLNLYCILLNIQQPQKDCTFPLPCPANNDRCMILWIPNKLEGAVINIAERKQISICLSIRSTNREISPNNLIYRLHHSPSAKKCTNEPPIIRATAAPEPWVTHSMDTK